MGASGAGTAIAFETQQLRSGLSSRDQCSPVESVYCPYEDRLGHKVAVRLASALESSKSGTAAREILKAADLSS